jgi:hypothetical protein
VGSLVLACANHAQRHYNCLVTAFCFLLFDRQQLAISP